MTLITALTHSAQHRRRAPFGHDRRTGNAKLSGRAKIVANAHAMGIRTPLPDTPSLPIGADEVTMLDHVGGAYATFFPNLGTTVKPSWPSSKRRTGAGELIWRFDRDGPKPHRTLSATSR